MGRNTGNPKPGMWLAYAAGALIALVALFLSHSLWQRSRDLKTALLATLNAATLALYVAFRIVVALLQIHPDIV